jgi:uncharacterized protein
MLDTIIKFGSADGHLGPAPIRSGWILEGNPVARNKLLSRSSDGTASTYIWDCTSGRFNWFYDIDETVCILEGGVVVRDAIGGERALKAGDTVFFPAGSNAEWTIEAYVRKIAFLREPLPGKILLAKRAYRALKRVIKGGGPDSGAMAPAMFQGN